ncbi:MAG: transporter [Caulobacteraceae bacterium]|nr:transporter [Caulobacteraceae bacterium]
MTATTASASAPRKSLRTVIAASMIGTTIEWYDFFLYGSAAALVFNKLFFPKSDPLTGAMLALATYALGFAARPLGGIVFGHFGDRIGRKRLLMLSLLLMGGATMLIGLLPTYAQIGSWAALLLVILRMVQGFAVGGEWGGAILLVAEHGDAKRRGFLTSWPQAGVALGNLIATALLALMASLQSEADFLAWGWRVPFLLSAVLIAVGVWVRTRVAESPAFEEIQREARTHSAPIIETVRNYPKPLLLGMGIRIAENLSYYIVVTFSLLYATTHAGLSRQAALNALMIGAAVQSAAIPFFGWLSDQLGRKPVTAFGALWTGLWAFAFFRLIDQGSPGLMTVAIVGGLIGHAAMYGAQAAFLTEMFPTRIRYSGVSLAAQVSSIFAGSMAPIVAAALLKRYDSSTPISAYVALGAAITLVSVFLARETKGKTFEEIDRS